MTRDRQLIDDATESAVAKWGLAITRGKRIQNWVAWAFRVGQNAAKRLGAKRVLVLDASVVEVGADPVSVELDSHDPEWVANLRELLGAALALVPRVLTPTMLVVVEKICEPGMTKHRAARELGMDRTSFKRSLARATRRLRLASLISTPPPPLS